MNKEIIKLDDTKIKNYKFHWHKSPILIDNIDINKIVVSNKVSFGKKDFKYFFGYKDAKKVDLHAYFFQKWVHVGEILRTKLCLFG